MSKYVLGGLLALALLLGGVSLAKAQVTAGLDPSILRNALDALGSVYNSLTGSAGNSGTISTTTVTPPPPFTSGDIWNWVKDANFKLGDGGSVALHRSNEADLHVNPFGQFNRVIFNQNAAKEVHINGPLCLNGTCRSEWPSGGTTVTNSGGTGAQVENRRLIVDGDIIARTDVGGAGGGLLSGEKYVCVGHGANRRCIGGEATDRKYYFMEQGAWCGMATLSINAGPPFGIVGNVNSFPCLGENPALRCPQHFKQIFLQSGMAGGFATCMYEGSANQN